MTDQVQGAPAVSAAAQPAAAPAAPVASAPAAPATPATSGQQPAPVAPEAPVAPLGAALSISEAPVVPVAQTAPTGSETKNSGVEVYKTDDPGMNLAMDFVSKLGFTAESNEIKLAVEKGDFSLIEAKLASMGEKANGWKEHMALARAYLEAEDAKFEAHMTACENVCFETAGSKEDWVKVQAWASKNADDDEKAQINEALKGGKTSARMASQYLINLYNNAHGTVVEPQSPLAGGQPTNRTVQTPISRVEYAQQVQELRNKLGGNFDTHPEYLQLRARFAASL